MIIPSRIKDPILLFKEVKSTFEKTLRSNLDSLGSLRGYCTSYQKIACFVLYLKIINNVLKNKVCILYKIVQGTQKWH